MWVSFLFAVCFLYLWWQMQLRSLRLHQGRNLIKVTCARVWKWLTEVKGGWIELQFGLKAKAACYSFKIDFFSNEYEAAPIKQKQNHSMSNSAPIPIKVFFFNLRNPNQLPQLQKNSLWLIFVLKCIKWFKVYNLFVFTREIASSGLFIPGFLSVIPASGYTAYQEPISFEMQVLGCEHEPVGDGEQDEAIHLIAFKWGHLYFYQVQIKQNNQQDPKSISKMNTDHNMNAVWKISQIPAAELFGLWGVFSIYNIKRCSNMDTWHQSPINCIKI